MSCKIITIDLANVPPIPIRLGVAGENTFRTITFDATEWGADFPGATYTVIYKRPDGYLYPVLVNAAADAIVWSPTETDTATSGSGLLEVRLLDGETVGKTITMQTVVAPSLTGNESTPPQPAPDWVNDVAQDADRAELATSHYPKIVNGVWYVWSVPDEDFVSTGIEAQGEDGYSPTVTVTEIEGGHRVTITDADGAHTFDVMDGADGEGGGAVDSVNGKTGTVVLDASDVGALPDDTQIPTKTSELTNNSGFVTAQQAAASAPVQSVNGKTGTVTLGAADVHALPDSTVIPPTVTEQTVAGWGFTKNTGTYSKPSGGIPASDLASGVIPSVPQMATQANTQDWAEGKVVDAFTLKTVVASAVQQLLGLHDSVQFLVSDKADKTELPGASTSAPVMDGTAAVGTSTDYARADHIHPSDTTRLSTTGNAYRSASIPMGHLDATSTATVMTATVDGITELRDGVCMWLRNGVITSASGFTINVNGLGAKPCYSSLAAESRSTTIFNVNYALLMIYNSTRVEGGCWDIVYGVDTNTTYTPPKLGFGYGTCTTAAATAAKTTSISSYALTAGGIVSIKFDNDVPAGATLNITSKGAKAIYHRGAAITAGVIKAGDTATFVYSTYYHLIAIDRDDAGDALPAVTASDNGKVLGVVNGAWAVKSDEGGASVTVDDALSTTSENPVQNKVVKAALDAKADASALAAKQDALTAGQNITISGNTISAYADSAEIAADVTDWLDNNVTPVGSAVVVDSSLSVEGAAADAKAAGQFKQYLQHDTIEATVLDVVRGKYVNPSTGVISDNPYWYSCEDFYPVTAGQIYSIGNNGKSLYATPFFVWYKSDKTYISSEEARFSTAPSEAAFLRFTIIIDTASTEVYQNGRFVLQNQKYPSEIKLDNLQNLRVSQTDDRLVKDVLGAVNENVNVVDDSRAVVNLMDGIAIRSGYRCDPHGVGSAPQFSANASFWTTDPIPVEPEKTYTFWKKTDYGYECNSNAGAAIFLCYNSALEQISNANGVYRFTTPADCYFVVPTFVTDVEGLIILTDVADVDLPFGKPIIKNAYGLTSAYGKKWLLFGDSITEVNFRAKAHYQDFIRKELGLTVVNEAVSGAGYHTRLNDNVAVYQKIGASTVTDPDLVTIMAGINDIAIESPAPDLGTVSDTTNATVMGCVYLAVQAARTKWPTVPLAILSPVPQSSTVPTADKSSRMEQFIALMTEFCRLNSIPFLDQYTGSPMRPWDSAWNAKYYSCASSPNGDGTHPNMYGHDLMHGKIREFIRTLL